MDASFLISSIPLSTLHRFAYSDQHLKASKEVSQFADDKIHNKDTWPNINI